MAKKNQPEEKPKVNVNDLPSVEEDTANASLFVVEFSMIALPNGTASNGDFVTDADLGNTKDLHLERRAIRAANLDEQMKYETAVAK